VLIQVLYNNNVASIEKLFSIHLNGRLHNSVESLSGKGHCILVLFLSFSDNSTGAWPGKIHYFFKHRQRVPVDTSQLLVEVEVKYHIFAFVKFFTFDSKVFRKFGDNGLKVWKSEYHPLSRNCIIPIHRIYSQVTVVNKGNKYIVVILLQRKYLFELKKKMDLLYF
jgi:hypothetical protein